MNFGGKGTVQFTTQANQEYHFSHSTQRYVGRKSHLWPSAGRSGVFTSTRLDRVRGKGRMCGKRLGKRSICRSWLTCHDKTHIGLNLRLYLNLTSI